MAAGWTFRGAASVMGTAHELDQTPCQDTHIVRTSPSGAWTGVVVCDGAGSAKFSKIGAEIASKRFADRLMEIAIKLEQREPGAWINDELIAGVVTIRQELRVCAGRDDLRDYHTTLLAALVGPTRGVCVHIGDGAIFGGCFREKDGVSVIDADWFLSEPENGEYANETFFITEAGWVKHLRISLLPPLDWIALATDGGAALALTHRNELKSEFILGLFHELRHGPNELSAVIKNALSDPASANITGDDKTLALLVREGMLPPDQNRLDVAGSKFINPPLPAGLERSPTQGSGTANITGASSPQTFPSTPEKKLPRSKGSNLKIVIILIFAISLIIGVAVAVWLLCFPISFENHPIKNPSQHVKQGAGSPSRGDPATGHSAEPQGSEAASPEKHALNPMESSNRSTPQQDPPPSPSDSERSPTTVKPPGEK